MPKQVKKYGQIALVFGLVLVLIAMYGLIPSVKAGTVTARKDALSDSRPSTVSNHTITFTIESAVDAGDTITITFAAGFTMGSVDYTDIDITDDTVDLTLAATPGTGAGSALGAAISGQVLTITENDTDSIAAGSVVEIEIGTNATHGVAGDQQITNPTAAVYDIDVAGTFGDTGKMKVAVLAAISVTATIAESLTFAISDTTIGMGTMTTANVYFATADTTGATSEQSSDAPTKLTVTTNASGGVTITMHDVGDGGGNAGLYKSTATTDLIAAVGANSVAAGTEGYAVYGKDESGLTIASGFDSGTSTGVMTTSPQTFASATGAVSSADVDVQPKAGIAATTVAGDYSDTLIFVATPTY